MDKNIAVLALLYRIVGGSIIDMVVLTTLIINTDFGTRDYQATHDKIGSKACLSYATVSRSLTSLVKAGYVNYIRIGQQPNTYSVNMDTIITEINKTIDKNEKKVGEE